MANKIGDEVFAGSDGMVVCQNSQGLELQAKLLKLTRFQVVFEVHTPACVLRTSEVLTDFKITVNERLTFSGRAVVSNLINMGASAVCEAALDESWIDLDSVLPVGEAEVREEFDGFLRRWQKNYRVLPEFKIVVADMQSLLADLRLWLDQVELGLRALPESESALVEHKLAVELGACTAPVFAALFEKFEMAARSVPVDSQSAHRSFCRRQLLPLLLSSPFMHRIYTKPLGYAGDYEMVNMILRPDPYEGSSLFAKMLNGFILSASPAVAHRNRVVFLTQKLVEETNRLAQRGRPTRIFNIGCGPAGEVQAFVRDYALSDRAHFTLQDANDETLAYTARVLEDIRRKNGRQTSIRVERKSVQQLIKNGNSRGGEAGYDFVYCAGLFDYLNDRICTVLMRHFYDMLAPGGLLVVTNVDAYNPIRNIMEYLFEWHLIYRTGAELATLAPDEAPPDAVSVKADPTSSNIFLEVRKPGAAP